MSDPVEQQSIETVEKQIDKKSKAQIEAELKAQVDQKIDITVKKLVKKFGPIAQQYENTAKKVAKRFILNLPIIGEGYAAILDFLDTFDTFVDNLEPTLESLLLALQLLNLKLHVDKESGKQHVSIPEGSLEAVEKLLAGTLSDTKKKNLQMVLDKMKKLRDMEKSVTNRVNQRLTNVQENNKRAANEISKKIDQTSKTAKEKVDALASSAPGKGGGRKKLTSTRTRRIKHLSRRSPLAKSKVVNRSTRRRARRSMRA